MSLFQYNSQQWFNTDSIETIDDYGYDIGVRLKSGREVRVPESMREAFFDAVKPQMVIKQGSDDEEMLRLIMGAATTPTEHEEKK